MPESWNTKLTRWGFNLFPCFRASGGRLTYIAADWKEVHLTVPLNWRTRNYVGTIFGGSMFAASDPMFMLMLIKILGSQYVIWDKSGYIRFRKPGRARLTGRFVVTDEDIEAIRSTLETEPKVERTFKTTLVDAAGEVHAEIERLVHIRRA